MVGCEEMRLYDVLALLLPGIMIVIIFGVSFAALFSAIPVEIEIVEGNVTTAKSHADYIEIIMDDGKVYKINYPGDNIDLTKGSHIIMKLEENGCFWFHDDIWDSVSITKVP